MSKKPLKVAINGYGRIGRCLLRALYESGRSDNIKVIAINELAHIDSMVYLTRYDSTHGVFPGTVEQDNSKIIVNGDEIKVFNSNRPEEVSWHDLGIDILMECSGQYSERTELHRFIESGCPRILLSHPGASSSDVDKTIVYGVNHSTLDDKSRIVSAASCTTNAIVPVLDMLHSQYGVNTAFLTTWHSVMNDQPLIDGYHHHDLRRTRSAMQSIVPVATGLAQGVERLLPMLSGRVHAKAIRVPIHNVSAIDLVTNLNSTVSKEELNNFLKKSTNKLKGLFAHSERPHASIDFNHNPHSGIIDTSHTSTSSSGLANILVWFDNEWGFANRMIDVAEAWQKKFI